MKEIVVFEGSEILLEPEFKLVHVDNSLTMDEYDFECVFYCNPRKVLRITKQQMKRSDADGYIARIDTKLLGPGSLHCKVIAYIPDTYGGNEWLKDTVWDGPIGYYIQKVRV